MNIMVDVVRVSGFRAIHRTEVELGPVTVLIGMNNAGKTSLLKAMQLAFGDYSRQLSEEDFHVGSDDKRASQIVIDVRIVPTDHSGSRIKTFDPQWSSQFGDAIQSEPDGRQYVAIRSRSQQSKVSASYETEKKILNRWPEWSDWPEAAAKESRTKKYAGIAYVSIEAQRDIYHDLRDRHSFVGKVLSSVEYNDDEVEALEALIAEVNETAVQGSTELTTLRGELDKLNGSSLGSHVVELTPFPKKIRDMAKYFTLQTGAEEGVTFSMEYHGMGTRSWASILALKAFTELESRRRLKVSAPYLALVAAEEPEAHLHPNAQRVLYEQLRGSCGQVLLSTHSPYLAGAAEPSTLRHLRVDAGNGVTASCLTLDPSTEDYRRLRREVIHSRGEILFSKLLILCEGETEEQCLPELFQKYFDCPPFAVGASIIGVGGCGRKYLPFLVFARDFGLPVFVFSDGESQTVAGLKNVWREVFGLPGEDLPTTVTVLDGTDLEGYLVRDGFQSLVERVIHEVNEQADYVDQWIADRHGQPKPKGGRTIGTCATCSQPLREGVRYDYAGVDGRQRALADILRKRKTEYAPAVTAALCGLEKDDLPLKVKQLFESMRGAIT